MGSSRRIHGHRIGRAAGVVVGFAALMAGSSPAFSASVYDVGPITQISASCAGQNAEVEQAVDADRGAVSATWRGCRGIAFARSTDGGLTFDRPISVPGSVGSNVNAWDPAIAVAPDGTVYAAFMLARSNQWYPVVATSFDHGLTFSQIAPLLPPDAKNWGDRDFLAVGPDGSVYLTWDYGPERTSVTYICASNGSCAFSTGDLNVVMQRSIDRGATWSAMSEISPGFPASGGDSAPLVIEPSGRIDVLYQGYQITDTTTYAMNPAYSYFTASDDHGASWSSPVRVGASGGTMSLAEWWIDGDIGIDASGTLYATWDTQGTNKDGSLNDVGWLSFSTDHGTHWSAPLQAPADRLNVPHIMEVVGGGSGEATVGWLSSSDPRGYAQYLRPFSTANGWLADPVRVSTEFGDPAVWPGDTFGLSSLSPSRVVVSWGSAVASSGKKSEIFAAGVEVLTH
jgi:hypothetical protein